MSYKDCDPWAAIAGKLLELAVADARKGDLGALAWLIADGTTMAKRLHPDGDDWVLRFAQAIFAEMDAGHVRAIWKIEFE